MTELGNHPYKLAPSRAFWSRAVSKAFDTADLISYDGVLIRKTDKVVSAGSCFASNLVPYLDKSGLSYHRTETVHPVFAEFADDNFGYARFSASYGNIYTVRQLLQLLRRCRGQFSPQESFWVEDGMYVDPFRPGLKFKARSEQEFRALTRQHLSKTLVAFEEATVFVLTLGLTEGWVSISDGAVFPACPGTIAGKFDDTRHKYHNFSVAEVEADLLTFISEMREINPHLKFITTVSPVPLVATAGGQHVLCASTYSKSILRVAAESAAAKFDNVVYFPAFEIVTGPQAPDKFFEADKRNVTAAAVESVMCALLAHCEVEGAVTPSTTVPVTESLATLLVDSECEEVMSER